MIPLPLALRLLLVVAVVCGHYGYAAGRIDAEIEALRQRGDDR